MKIEVSEYFCILIMKISGLNSLSSSKVIENSTTLIAEVLQCEGVGFYMVSSDDRYLRLVTKSYKNSRLNIKKSLDLGKVSELRHLIEGRKTFVKKEFNEELPKIMVPIVINNKTRATLAIYDGNLEDIEEMHINLFEVLGEAVTNALVNAYTYENAIESDRYINNTGVLTAEYFKEIIDNKEYFRINNGAVYSLIKLSHKLNNDVEYLYYNLKSQLRGMDYIGINEREELYLLLSNTSNEEASFVVDRLIKRGFEAEIVEGI